jgi:hypothetical protein
MRERKTELPPEFSWRDRHGLNATVLDSNNCPTDEVWKLLCGGEANDQ